jgi:elongation factor 1-beta
MIVMRFKVLPVNAETSPEELKNKISNVLPKDIKIANYSEEPIAFGLRALILNLITDEKDGILDEVENAISSCEDVSSFELIGVSRASTKV